MHCTFGGLVLSEHDLLETQCTLDPDEQESVQCH